MLEHGHRLTEGKQKVNGMNESVGLVFSVAGVLALAVPVLWMRHRAVHRQQLKVAFRRIIALRGLIYDVQVHRGRCHATLNGDESSRRIMLDARARIDRSAAEFRYMAYGLSELQRPLSAIDQWDRLKLRADSLPPAASFHQHTALIQDLLGLMERLIHKSHLGSRQAPEQRIAVSQWITVLRVAEMMGQVRAIGAGIASGGSCTGAQRLRLSYLLERLVSVRADLAALGLGNSSISAGITELMVSLKEQAMATDCTIDPSTYFESATRQINLWYAYFDEEVALAKRAWKLSDENDETVSAGSGCQISESQTKVDWNSKTDAKIRS